MCRLPKLKQIIRKGQLSCSAHGANPSKSVRCIDVVFIRWFLWVQPGPCFPCRSVENHFQDTLGNLCLQEDALRFDKHGGTFQRAMDADFRGLINHYVVFYLDDATVSSKNRSDHISHLQKVLERCMKFGISLNPKKSIFGVSEGILPGFVVSKKGIMINPKRT